MRGERFGELTVILPAGRGPGRVGRLWFCRCDCGGSAIRSTSELNRTRSGDRGTSCRRCADELRAGRLIELRSDLTAIFRKSWEDYGDLYSPYAVERMERDIREAVAAEIGTFTLRLRPPVECVEGDYPDGSEREPGTGDDPPPLTFEEIGAEMGCTGSYVQQIYWRALARFAQNWRRMFKEAPPFAPDDEAPRAAIDATRIDAAIESAKRTEEGWQAA